MDSPAVPDALFPSGLAAMMQPDLDPMLQDALRQDQGSAWFGHVPFAFWLMQALRPRLVVELGTHDGVSYAAFCQSVRRLRLDTRCFAVDARAGDEQAAGFSQVLRCTFDDAAAQFDDGTIDLLHIDGPHTYDAVRHDFETWRPRLSDRAVVLFHRTAERQSTFGVWRLWAELSARHPAFEFTHAHGLGVLCVGPRAAETVLALTRLDQPAAHRARSLFTFLGARWEDRSVRRHLETAVHHLEGAVALRDTHVGDLERHIAADKALTDGRLATAAHGAARMAQALIQAQDEAARFAAAAADQARLARQHAAALDQARTRLLELQDQVVSLRGAHAASLRPEQAARIAAEQALRVITAQAAHVVTERDRLLSSTSWRLTGPVRRLARLVPASLKPLARRAAKLAWWMFTPWRIPLRLQYRRERLALYRQQAEAAALDLAARSAAPPPPATAQDTYRRWMEAYEPAVFVQIGEDTPPPVSILLPAAGQDDRTAATIGSLLHQTDSGWTLVVPDLPDARAATAALANDRRLLRVPCPPEADRAGLLAALLAAAPDTWVMVLDSGDVLAPGALKWLSMAVTSEPRIACVYADEDRLDPDGMRITPQFKPGWSPDLLTAYNYIGHPALLSRDLARAAGGYVPGQGDAAEWDLNLRLADAAAAAGRPIRRLAAVLCHRPGDIAHERPAAGTRASNKRRAALQAHWERRGRSGVEVHTRPDGTHHATWTIDQPPLVSVIIPNRNSPDLLRRCTKGLMERTGYRSIELLIVENGSDDPQTLALYRDLEALGARIVPCPGPFNHAAACNHGARHAGGDLLLFLGNGIEVRDPAWLDELVRTVQRPGVGVVGTELTAPDGTLQHAGVAAGPYLLGLMFHRAPTRDWGVFGSPGVVRNWSAVTGACQMVRREAFDQVGGFDEAFESADSGIVLCLRAGRFGYRTAYTPHAGLVHHEDTARGHESPAADRARFARELHRLGLQSDPFFHPGLSGNDPVPTLRAPGEPDGAQAIAVLSARFIAASPLHGPWLDLFDDAAVLAATDLPRAHVLPAPLGGEPVTDAWSAARWVVILLRARTDLRIRFPHALTAGAAGPFATWLAAGTEGEMALPPGLAAHLPALWAQDPARRPRQVYFWRDDVHGAHPAGMLPPGYASYVRYLFRDGQFEYRLRLEEAWWFLLGNAERPAAELVRAYRFNIAWQTAHPLGLTVFGATAFATWIAERYGIDGGAAWLDPAAWPDLPSAADQVRLAYGTTPAWRQRHPAALSTPHRAAALLAWLASPAGGQAEPVRRWCAAHAASGHALASPAVTVLGHFCYPSGLRVSAEALCDAMHGVGLAVTRRDIRIHLHDDPPHTSFGALEAADITIIHTQPGELFLKAHERADLAPRTPRTYRIGYWYWELEEVPETWRAIAGSTDEIWTATEFVARGLRRVVDVPVHVIFPGVRIGAFPPVPRESLGAPARGAGMDGGANGGAGRFAFLFSFHMASITERKNPMGLIAAFRRAFAPEEAVDLVIKATSEDRHVHELAELRTAALGHNITVIDAVFSPEQTLALMADCDAYISLHRAEGLGLGMAEAMLLGKPVIASRYSGNLQFMDDTNSLLVDCAVVPIGREIHPYDAASRWAEPSVDHAAKLMRQLFDDQPAAAALGRKAQAAARVSMSLETAGRAAAARLVAIRARIDGRD